MAVESPFEVFGVLGVATGGGAGIVGADELDAIAGADEASGAEASAAVGPPHALAAGSEEGSDKDSGVETGARGVDDRGVRNCQ